MVTDVNRAKEILTGTFTYECQETYMSFYPYDEDGINTTGEELTIDLSKIPTEVLSQIIIK